MKNKYFLLPALALAVASCSQTDEPGLLPESAPAAFSAQIGQSVSRASGTQWDAGDAIGISGVSGTMTYSNVEFVTSSGDGNFTSEGDIIYYQTTDPVTFTAYYPYSEALGADGIINASTADQTQLPAFDFLWSQASGNYAAPAVNFIFTHRMSKINIAFTNGNDVDLSDLTFSIDGLVLDGTFDTATGEAKAAANGSTASLTASLIAESKASLIVFPQSAEKLTVTATAEGQQYFCTLSPGALVAGNAYTFNISVKKTEMTVTGCTITPWADGGNTDGDAILPPPAPLPYTGVKVGDYMLSNGECVTPSEMTEKFQKQAIGIVVYLFKGNEDKINSSVRSTLAEQGVDTPHGYVMALKNANGGEKCGFQTTGVTSFTDCVDGLDYYNHFVAQNYDPAEYPAIVAARNYKPLDDLYFYSAPQFTTGWYLPGRYEWETIIDGSFKFTVVSGGRVLWDSPKVVEAINKALSAALTDNTLYTPFEQTEYWAAWELNHVFSGYMYLTPDAGYMFYMANGGAGKNTPRYVRPILAF